MIAQQLVLDDITSERFRQEALRDLGRFRWTLADVGLYTPAEALAVLSEEFGEIARVVCEGLGNRPVDTGHLREELVQLAACCVAWVEALDSGDEMPLSGPESDGVLHEGINPTHPIVA